MRKARGLEGALVDRDKQTVKSLDGSDERAFEINVAGPAALVVAKVFKIHERRDDPRRLSDKDALDVLRLLRAKESAEIAARMLRIEADAEAREVAVEAIGHLPNLFGSPDALGCIMAARATRGLEDEAEISQSLYFLTDELLSEIERLRDV